MNAEHLYGIHKADRAAYAKSPIYERRRFAKAWRNLKRDVCAAARADFPTFLRALNWLDARLTASPPRG